ncbi:MAG TPA: class I SAM-dependent methyltransferase [Polyangiaceae bacterium]|nr:class I SAM-dependent methyltransferase [Polyangiaceae bacterium]
MTNKVTVAQNDAFDSLLSTALSRTAPVREHTNAYRLIDEVRGEIPGVSVEIYGDYAALLLYDEKALGVLPEVAASLLRLGLSGVYLKRHEVTSQGAARGQAPSELLSGVEAPQEFALHEDEQKALIWLREGASTGLFVDQRDNRKKVRSQCTGKSLLNLFCYTGSFTVAAALGGATQTVSVDISARALKRSSENLALNGCHSDRHRLLKDDARKWLDRANKRGDRFDWVVLDPPVFARVGKGTFSVTRDYVQLAARALSVLAEKGTLLSVLNHRGTVQTQMIGLLKEAAVLARRTVRRIETLKPPQDCCDAQGHSAVKSLLVEVAG